MAKKKKPSKRRKINNRTPSVKGLTQYEFHSYDEWKQNMPDWLKKIRVLTDHGNMIQATKLLVEEEIQEKLTNIDDNDTRSKFYLRCEVAMLLDSTGQVERALRYYSDSLKIVTCAGVYNKMGLLYANCGQNIQAIANFQKAEQLEPDGIYIWINLARCFMKTGRTEETLRLFRKAISINPQSREAYQNLIYCLNYLIDTKASEIFEESKKWAQIQSPTTLAYTDHDNSLDPHRKLRIGYISPDFKKHSVTYYFEPLLNKHDRNKFEIYGYGDIEKPDQVTERLVNKFDFYRDIKGVGDKDVAELIRSDSIDILVDLAGHTGRNRLHVLAYKPAPIQVAYLGYPNTTGMPQVDYRLTDDIADTEDQQQYYTEKLVFLPNGFLCYDPGLAQLPVKALPMTYNKYVTFGCFNNVNKLNPYMIKIWADLLDAVPNSKMIIKFREGEDLQIREYYYNLFTKHGLENAHERVTFFGWLTNAQHLELYNSIDIALDTYPYNGTTTTCEAVLMGVPVITLVGSRHASRVGLDILSRLDMPSFAAQSPEEYVKKAVALAVEPDALTQIRATMRQRLAASPLRNYGLITNDIENAYRQMWQDYCCSKGIEIKEIESPSEVDYKPLRYSDRAIIDLVAGDDKFNPAGQRTKTIKCAEKAFDKSSLDNPKQLLSMDNWQRPDWLKEASSLVSQGESEKAAQLLTEESLEKHIAAASQPEKEFIRYTAAGILRQIKQPQRAEILYKESLMSTPNNLAIYNDLAFLCQGQGRITEAVEYLVTAMGIKPDEPIIASNLGVYLMQIGQTEKAIAIFREIIKKLPDKNSAYPNFLFSLHYVPDVDRKDIFEESKRWAQSNAPAHLAKTNHNNDPDPHRRLRIGYISPDFREHSVTYFFEPLLDGHNREAVEVYGYGSVAVPDEATKRLRNKFDIYRDIKKLTDEEVANLIENDEIDILVDLAGHTASTRVHVLAFKPAPIQATWLGYPDTTGMSQVDYRITDSIADPPGSEKFYTEQLCNLPDGFLCYGPGERMPPMAPLPAITKGHITFGSFNESGKINSVVIDLWSKILKATKDSTLLLKFKAGRDNEFRQMCLQQFEKRGISPERITIRGFLSLSDHLKLYNRVDISLDTYPYNGTTTTCQSLLMGVPVISLIGDHHMSRVGLSILTRLGLEFFATSTPDEYVSKATALAAKPEALAKLRSSLRARMAVSPLCNRELFTKNIEQAYRTMWHRWCKTQDAGVPRKERKLHTQCPSVEAAEHSAVTQKKETTPAPQNLIPQANSHRLSYLAKLAVMADNFHRTGRHSLAVKYAVEGWNSLCRGTNVDDVPSEILLRWNVRDGKTLFLYLCISLISYSSYFSIPVYKKLFLKWKEFEPSNPEPYLRFGLLLALEAQQAGITVPSASLEALRHANKIMQDERSTAALALAQRKLTDLALPYDTGQIHLYPNLTNMTTYVLLEQGDWFEHDDLALFRTLIRPGDMVLDMGANVGVYAISAALRTGSQGCVVAVEPAKETFEFLNKSSLAFPHMTAIHTAISDKPGTAFLSHGGSSENFKLSDNNETKGEKVPLVTVDDIAAEHGIESVDIIKMDVEGYELKALTGAKKIISNGSPIIFYEVNHLGELHPELIDAFQDLGYDSYYALPDAITIVKYNKDIQIDEYLLNMIAIRPESLERLDELVNIEQSQVEVLKNR